MPNMDELLDAVKNQIVDHVQQGNHKNFDTEGLIGKISDLFGAHKQSAPSSRDIKPASQDPYGDPADEGRGVRTPSNVKPASQDPYGDPADEPKRR